MQSLPLEWDDIAAWLERIPEARPDRLYKMFFEKNTGFFHIRYEPAEIIMPCGVYSDYAGIHLRGKLRVLPGEERPADPDETVADCWKRPGPLFRRLEKWVLDRTDRVSAGTNGSNQSPAGRIGRAVASGVRSSRWFQNQRDNDLAEKRLAFPLKIATSLQHEEWADELREGIARSANDNQPFLERFMGVTGALWNQPRGATLAADPDETDEPCEMLLVKRTALLALEKQSEPFRRHNERNFFREHLPRTMSQNRLIHGLSQEQESLNFAALADSASPQLEHYEKGDVIHRQGEHTTGLSLIVNGVLQVTRELQRGSSLATQLRDGDYFGISSIFPGEDVGRSATVTATTDVNLVTIPKDRVQVALCAEVPGLEEKLRRKWQSNHRQDIEAEALQILPRAEPPERLVPKLMQGRNLLRIDMELCTRCDQCVQACADAHGGVPRFRRANPDLRFGKWEIAAACVHCVNAPCQKACPVGAITFLSSGAVHIHRSRCISCGNCVDPCPFDVIEMHPGGTPDEAPKAKATEEGGRVVATKCDLCLTEHHDPPCVAACPYGAAERGAPQELFPDLEQWFEPNPAAAPTE